TTVDALPWLPPDDRNFPVRRPGSARIIQLHTALGTKFSSLRFPVAPKEVYNPRNLKEAGMKRVTVLGALLVIGGLSAAIVAQQQPPRPPLPDLTKVKDNLYVIASSALSPEFTGGNTGVFVTESGVIVVDTKLSGYGPTILERIKKVTSKPVTMIINTHTHGDHTGSNEAFPATVDIVAHENT